jgi:hypothetical protein
LDLFSGFMEWRRELVDWFHLLFHQGCLKASGKKRQLE